MTIARPGIAAAVTPRRWQATVPGLLILFGAGLAGVALATDLVLGRPPEFGFAQALAATVGLASVAIGVANRVVPVAFPLEATLKFLIIVLELAAVVAIVRLFKVEHAAFYGRFSLLVFAGFVVHHFIPRAYRLAFFLALSVGTIALVIGPANAGWMSLLGLALIGICHLPIAYWARVAVLLLAGALVAALRIGRLVSVPWEAIWPILGSFFMFRLIAYMYALRHEKTPAPWVQRLGYFFLLPNVVFPLFPVVDYTTFRRTYYDDDALVIYQRGVHWVIRGVIHLLVYRVIYHYVAIPQESVANGADLARFMVSNFLLYLRVSGQFHIATGILQLFGFHLPETHNLFLLSTSLTDLWRRINIYWRDFMQKLVFNPLYYGSLASWRPAARLGVATALVFVATWFFHAYQWFWILGQFLLTWTDVTFWALLGGAVVATALWEMTRPKKRVLPKKRVWTLRGATARAAMASGTFFVICALWTLWSSGSFTAWFATWSVPGAAVGVLAVLAGGVVVAFVADLVCRPGLVGGPVGDGGRTLADFRLGALRTSTPVLALLAAGYVANIGMLGRNARAAMATVGSDELSTNDRNRMTAGYYTNLTGGSRNSQLWELYMKRPAENATMLWKTPAARKADVFTGDLLNPSASVKFLDVKFSTNQWAIRDRDYKQQKPRGTFRIVTLGTSITMGWGVEDGAPFEQRLEDALNQSRPVAGIRRYENLNFAHPGFTAPQQLLLMDRALAFRPDAVFYVGHEIDIDRAAVHLAGTVTMGGKIPFDSLDAAVRRATADADSRAVAEQRIKEHAREIFGPVYKEIADRIRAAGAVPVWVYLPRLRSQPDRDQVELIFDLVRNAGFVVLDIHKVYKGQDEKTLVLTDYDFHPNARGHRLIARELYEEIVKRRSAEIFRTAVGAR